MKTRYVFNIYALSLTALLAVACGDDDDVNHVDMPAAAPGGGVSGGSIKGELNVFVVDADDKPIAGADVRVGEPDDAAALTGVTDGAGLVVFTDAALAGAQVVSAHKSGYTASTIFGADGAVVTLALDDAADPPAPQTATITGSITGWNDLPEPAANHATIAFVTYGRTKELGAPENSINTPNGQNNLPLNACVKSALLSPPCAWSLTTRTGAQTIYAVIVDLDTKGTMTNADDTRTTIGFAVKSGQVTVAAGQTLANQDLALVAAGDVATSTMQFPAQVPTEVPQLEALPLMKLGDERLVFSFPGATPASPALLLPKATGAFAGATWDVFVQARSAQGGELPGATVFVRDANLSGTLTLPAIPTLPSALSATSGTYAFTRVAGASVHTADIVADGGDKAWGVIVLDDRASFSLPTINGFNLAAGSYDLNVSAIQIDGFDAKDFDVEALQDAISTIATATLAFTI
jgi:hypothetical protein